MAALFALSAGAAATRPAGVPPASIGQRLSGALGVSTAVQQAMTSPPPAAAPPAPAPSPAPPPTEVVIAPPPERFEAPPPAPLPPPVQLVEPLQISGPVVPGTGTWAVVVGIDDYPGTSNDLRSAVNDANDVDTALAAMGVPTEQRLVLRDGQATAGRIKEAVDWLVARAGPEATAVVFYGGHVRKVGLTSESLVAADGGLVSDRELGTQLTHLQAKRAWIAIAGCYGGGFTEVLAPGRVLTGAAGANDLAWESSEFGRSFLVQYMVREAMIERKAPDSVQAAFGYAVAELLREHPGRMPVQIDLSFGPIDLRPILPAAPPPAVTTTLPPPTTLPCRTLLLFPCRR